ncbi:MAG: alpha-amylase/4-alpha-glucanotransferase domain-containing protein, partial [Candidatus Omnitrophota bacterium]
MIGSLPNAYFAMGLHLHQPVGNFESILERAYSNCYNPFLDTLRNHPDIKCTFHFSGNLLDFFEDKHPDYLDKVALLVNRGQVEVMGGGYYEPIFQAIPHRDRIGQIEMLSSYIERRFGARPKGIWTPERVWVPELIKDFVSCGMKYTILDDAHLSRAGVSKDKLSGYFIASDKKDKIAIFPTTKTLRYSIPFRMPRDNIRYFKQASRKKKDPLFTYGDDAEKFGEWPWTHELVYKKGWLNNFFNRLRKSGKWLKTVTFSEYMESHGPLGEVDIPECAYEEMMEWSGGRWMNFLSKYPESGQMHRRMLYVSDKINGFETRNPKPETRNKIENAKKELYKGQTNCPYWHGVFGGIYLYHLRSAIYEHLIKADKILDSLQPEERTVRELDFYRRGDNAVISESDDFFICIDPASGGSIRELDYKPENLNIVNTLSRKKEAYHRKIIERINNKITEPLTIQDAIKTLDQKIRRGIFYDRYLRSSLVDHFIDRELKKQSFEDCNYMDAGGFAGAAYSVEAEKKSAILSHKGMVDGKPVCLRKEVRIASDHSIEISYAIKNNSRFKLETLFGAEFNITMPFADSERYVYESGQRLFLIKDSLDGLGIEFRFSENHVKTWHFPVMAVSQSERSYDLNYQAYCVFPIWDINLTTDQEFKFTILWNFLSLT